VSTKHDPLAPSASVMLLSFGVAASAPNARSASCKQHAVLICVAASALNALSCVVLCSVQL